MSVERVREELKLIRKVNKMTIDYIEAEKLLRDKEKILGSENIDTQSIGNLEASRKQVSELIEKTSELEKKYFDAFEFLPATGRKIIVSKVINCHSNRRIAINLCYSEVSIEKKLNAIYKRLDEILYQGR